MVARAGLAVLELARQAGPAVAEQVRQEGLAVLGLARQAVAEQVRQEGLPAQLERRPQALQALLRAALGEVPGSR